MSVPFPIGAPDAALDYRAGLERVLGDQAMYLRVLTRFHLDYHDSVARLRAATGAGDLALAQRIAHTLKGAAAMVEARCLRQLATDVEQALRSSAGADPLLVESLENELARVMAQLGVLLRAPGEPAEAAAAAAHAAMTEADMARLCEMLDTGDSAAHDLVEEQAGGLRALLGKARATQLQAAMAAFDFERALHLLRPDEFSG